MEFVAIRAYDNYVNANIALLLLKEAGIICYIKDEYTVTIDPLLNYAVGGMKLMVSSDQLVQARQVLENTEANFLQSVACPACGEFTLHKESETIIYANFIDRLKSILINGSAQKTKSIYKCGNCGRKFEELPVKPL